MVNFDLLKAVLFVFLHQSAGLIGRFRLHAAERIIAAVNITGEQEPRPDRDFPGIYGIAKRRDKFEFVGRIDDVPLLQHLARCRAVVFPTFNEDYGFVTVEAFASGKPVITCEDSGGPAELVRDGQNGFVTKPTAVALAHAMRAVMDDKLLAIRLGEAGAADVARMTWQNAVARLVL